MAGEFDFGFGGGGQRDVGGAKRHRGQQAAERTTQHPHSEHRTYYIPASLVGGRREGARGGAKRVSSRGCILGPRCTSDGYCWPPPCGRQRGMRRCASTATSGRSWPKLASAVTGRTKVRARPGPASISPPRRYNPLETTAHHASLAS